MSPTVTILLVGACVGASCALIGSFLVLRRMALLGDAISHAVLPGIVVAFLLTGSRNPVPMVLGAAALGVLTVFLVELAHRTRLLKADSSIGVVFPVLFALGVILISRYAHAVDLDLDCVLHGEIAFAPWDLLILGGVSYGPKALWVNGLVLLLNLGAIALFYKELKLSTFDPALAMALGFSPVLIHYALMTLVSVTVVGAFESVGAILVVAMLIVPPATAKLLTDRLSRMLLLSSGLGILCAVGGYGLARWWDASIAGSMATLSGVIFVVTLLAAPQHGLMAKTARQRTLRRGFAEQLLLLHLRQEGGHDPTAELLERFGWAEGRLRRVVERLERRGWVRHEADSLHLTGAGLAAIEESGQAPLRHPA